MTDEPQADPPPAPAPAPADAPQWAQDLQRTLVELPGKLSASVTDDDKSQIAEQVHGLFEKSGAFTTEQAEKEGEKAAKEDEKTGEGTEEAPPRKTGRLTKFASRFEGDAQ